MSMSRRGLLRNAAAALTASGAAPVKGVQIASVIAASAAGLGTDRIAQVFETLGKRGGFPHTNISGLGDRITNLAEQELSSLLGRMQGMETWAVHQALKTDKTYSPAHWMINIDNGNVGKINFTTEGQILTHLVDLPPHLPMLDLLDKQVIENLQDAHIDDSNRDEKYKKTEKLKNALRPLCYSNTTPADLIEDFKQFFVSLGHHALSGPKDFPDGMSGLFSDGYFIDIVESLRMETKPKLRVNGSSLDDLINILQFYAQDDSSLYPMIEKISKISKDLEEEKRRSNEEENKRYQQRLEELQQKQAEQERIQKAEEALITPWSAEDVRWVLHVGGSCKSLSREFDCMAALGLDDKQFENAAHRLNDVAKNIIKLRRNRTGLTRISDDLSL